MNNHSSNRRRYSLRTFLIAMSLLCLLFGWKAEQVRIQQNAIEEIRKLGGSIWYDSQVDEKGMFPTNRQINSAWNPFDGLLADDWFNTVTTVHMRYTEEPARLRGAKNAPKEVVPHLARLPGLRRLRLSFTDVSNDDLAPLSKLKHLRFLTLQSTKVKEGNLDSLKGLRLEELSLERTRLSDEGLKSLRHMESLRYLNATRTKVTDAGLVHLESLPNLVAVKLNRTLVTREGYEAFRKKVP